jgi:hypothetical protein
VLCVIKALSKSRLASSQVIGNIVYTMLQHDNNKFVTGYSSTVFEGELERLCNVLSPIAKAVQCLESSHSTAGDVFLFFLAIASSYKEFLSAGAQGLSIKDQESIRKSINYRFRQQIDNNACDIYFASFILDPRLSSFILCFSVTLICKQSFEVQISSKT